MDAQGALAALQQPLSLSILKLSAPYLPSNEQATGANPSILSADLAHYQELFSKLRFSYVEQVTKERFLRAITAEQPELVDAAENAEFEQRLKQDKSQLKERKVEVRELIRELEEQGRQLSDRYENLQLQTSQVETLPNEIAGLQETIATLRQSQAPKSDNPELCLALEPTLNLLADREQQLSDLDREIEMLRNAIPQKQAQVAALQDEVTSLNSRKIKAVDEAKDARKRRENGGMGDELDERGRWLRAVDAGLRTMLEV